MSRYPAAAERRHSGLCLAATLAALLSALQLGGCARSSVDGDGPPVRSPDLATLAEPTPRAEPASRYGNPASYEVFGRRYRVSASSAGYLDRGRASWYGAKFHGRRTSSGEPYDMYALSAAHKNLPIPTYVRVTNLDNGRSLVVRVNDRGPFHDDRIIDLSYAAALKLDLIGPGTAPVEVRALPPYQSLAGSTPRGAARLRQAAAAAAPGGLAGHRQLFLQVGAYRQLHNAERMRSRLEAELPGRVAIHALAGASPTYRVRVGPFPTSDGAQAAAAQLTSLGLSDTQLVSHCEGC